MTEKTSGALASNAGDQYHFVYAARRMLDMLHPRRNLSLIVMEGVSSGDIDLGDGPETFLAVDLTEYYGGEDHQSADRIVITQVKYSPSHPNRTWTLNRLCADRSSDGSASQRISVIRKLARIFDSYCTELGTDGIEGVTMQIHSNQSLDPDLSDQLKTLRELLEDKTPYQASAILRDCDGQLGTTLATLREATKLSWLRLALFICSWNLDEFGQASLAIQRGRLFEQVSGYQARDAHLYQDRLCFFAQESATAFRPHEVRPGDVFAQLQIHREDFFPAPYRPEPIDYLQPTQTVAELEELIETTNRDIVLVHGLAGSGKSVALRQFAEEYAGGEAVVLYDCWAGGDGLQPGSERYPLTKFFTQVTNELENLYYTNIFANRKDDYETIVSRFKHGLEAAAETAADKGHRLVIAVDAADNAVTAYRSTDIKRHDCFIPVLWNVDLPPNCIIVVSSRTESVPRLEIPDTCAELEVTGFQPEESAQYIRAHISGADDGLVEFAHERTRGNPRILWKILERGMREEPDDWAGFVDQIARISLQEYYEEAFESVQEDVAEAPRLLSIVLELISPRRTPLLAQITGQTDAFIEDWLDRMYFGLRVTQDGEIEFTDQDFYESAQELTADLQDDTQDTLASFCRESYADSAYAQDNLAYHLYKAGRPGELVEWQLSGNLKSRLEALSPNQEDVFPEIQYGLKAAVDLDRFDEALKLLAHAATVAQGRDVFARIVTQFIDTAVQFGYHHRLLRHLEESKHGRQLASSQLQIAAMLARLGNEPELAADLIQHGYAAIRQADMHLPEEQRRAFSVDDVRFITLYECFDSGLTEALERLGGWTPQKNIYSIYADVANEWVQLHPDIAFRDIQQAGLDELQHVHALAGLLVSTSDLPPAEARQVLQKLVQFVGDQGSSPSSLTELFPRILYTALKLGLFPDELETLLSFWRPRLPRSPAERWRGELEEVYHFLRRKAIDQVLGLGDFAPENYEPSPDPDRPNSSQDDRRELESLRKQLIQHYPAALARAQAVAGHPEEEVIEQVEKSLQSWLTETAGYWYKPNWQYVDYACECLEAIVALDGVHYDTVEGLCEAVDQVLPDVFEKGLTPMAEVLSHDPRYHGIAERLIQQRVDDASRPSVDASTRVEVLLELCPVLARIDFDQASTVFERARREASRWDPRASSRALALVHTASATQAGIGLSTDQMARLSTIFHHIGDIDWDQEGVLHFDKVVRVIARENPAVALQTMRTGERKGHISLGEGVLALSQGVLDTHQANPEAVWPLVHVVHPDAAPWPLFEQAAAELIEAGNEPILERVLDQWALHVRRDISRDLRLERTHALLQWAESQDLKDDPTIDRMQEYAVQLEAIGLEKTSQSQDLGHYRDEPSEEAQMLEDAVAQGPVTAFNKLQSLTDKEIDRLSISELRKVLEVILPVLTTRQAAQIAEFIVRRNWRYDSSQALRLLVSIAERTHGASQAFETTQNCIRQLVDASFPLLIRETAYYENEGLYKLLACEVVDLHARIDIVLSAAVGALTELSSEQIYWLIAHIGERLPGEQAGTVLALLLEQATEGTSGGLQGTPSVDEQVEELLVRFLCDLLGDPRQRVSWQAVYALVELALQLPEVTLPILFEEAGAETHPRWMTVREWTMFIIRHLSLRCPAILIPYVDQIVSHALNTDFPHAKIREHAKQSVLSTEEAAPDSVSIETPQAVKRVNEPIACLVPDLIPAGDFPYDGTKWSDRRFDEEPFNFDSMDTMPYWFAPMAHCFGLHRCHVCDAAKRWVVDIWGVTDERCREDNKAFSERYRWQELSHSQGGYPAVMTLPRYVEHHSLYLVAGEFIDAKPAYSGSASLYRTWEDWGKYHLNLADPALTSRLLDGPPILPDHFGIFEEEFDLWTAKERADDFRNELTVETNQEDWLVVSASRRGSFPIKGRNFSIHVSSALVEPETASALARAIESEDANGGIYLPFLEISYDVLMDVLDESVASNELAERHVPSDVSPTDEQNPFRLEPWWASWHTEMELHPFDPKWSSLGRSFGLPVHDLIERMRLRRVPLALDYVDPSGRMVACCQTWHDVASTDTERADYTEGYRLIINRDVVQQYLAAVNSWLILTVRIRRQRPYRWRGEYRDEYDRGAVRVYIFTDEGELSGC